MHITVEYIWYFIFYSFIYWVVEVSFQTIKEKYLLTRILKRTWCPVYGFGMILIIILLSPVKGNMFFLVYRSICSYNFTLNILRVWFLRKFLTKNGGIIQRTFKYKRLYIFISLFGVLE